VEKDRGAPNKNRNVDERRKKKEASNYFVFYITCYTGGNNL
jgi:hypothetical protein